MNFSYKFSSLAKEDFLKFLKTAEEQKVSNGYCDNAEYSTHKQLFELDETTKNELAEYTKRSSSINLDENEEEVFDLPLSSTSTKTSLEKSMFDLIPTNIDFTSELSNSIKEYLQVEKCLPEILLVDLIQNTDEHLEIIFELLVSELQLEDVVLLGEILLKSPPIKIDSVVQNYMKHLLLYKISTEFKDTLHDIFNKYSLKFPNQLIPLLSQHLLNIDDTTVVCLYIKKTNNDFKSSLLKALVFNCDKLNKNFILLVDILLNSNMELDSLNKLVEIMSNQVADFATDNSYGKVLFNVIKLLDKHVIQLERPLNHIIGSHSSIWKPKIIKLFNSYMENSLLFTQSFRCN